MADELRALNDDGRKLYREWLERLKQEPSLPTPPLLSDSATAYSPLTGVELPRGPFSTKLELAVALLPVVEQLEVKRISENRWPGIWDGLALHYFNEICPVASGGARKVKALERYYFTEDYRKRHRHRISGPIGFWRASQSAARLFLRGTPAEVSDQEEQVGSRQELGENPTALNALAALYWDSDKNRPKPGWAPNSHKPGTLRRFVALMNQLSRTYDILGCPPKGLVDLLPREFEKWRR